VPVIYMTGTQPGVRKAALESGCLAYLTKPFSAKSLIEPIEKHRLGSHRSSSSGPRYMHHSSIACSKVWCRIACRNRSELVERPVEVPHHQYAGIETQQRFWRSPFLSSLGRRDRPRCGMCRHQT